MTPPFDIEGGLWLTLIRSVAVAALLSVFGTLVFRTICAPRAFARMPPAAAIRVERQLLRLTLYGVGVAVAGMLGWLLLVAADMASARSAGQAVAALPVVLTDMAFGHLIIGQLAALLATAALLTWPRAALALAGTALLLQAGHSHAASMYAGPSVLLVAQAVHVLAAGAWLGGLLPLLLLVRAAPPRAGAEAARWFSPMGKLAIVALTASSALQGWVLVASIPGLVGTAYGWMVLVKLALFGTLFGFAVANRYRFAPALMRGDPDPAKRVLVRSIAVQTGFGLAIIAAAAVLSGLVPAMHAQPLWPFADRFTLDTINEDPDFRDEVIGAGLSLAVAILLLAGAALVRHPIRWVALATAAAIAIFATPHLDLLFVPAYPTSYYHSPTGFAAAAIAQGEALFPTHCASCHGAGGRGDGPAAAGLPEPPADLTADHLWMHSDGELFWWLSHGMAAPDGRPAMPGFAGALSGDERWALIDFIRARNAGLAYHATGAWPQPIQAPGMQAECVGGQSRDLADLRGGFVRVVIGAGSAEPGVTTVLLDPGPAIHPAAGLCVVRDEAAPGAYGLVAGLQAGEGPGAQFLIDDQGWLRAVQRPGGEDGWDDPKTLAASIQRLRAHPIDDAAMDHAHMQM